MKATLYCTVFPKDHLLHVDSSVSFFCTGFIKDDTGINFSWINFCLTLIYELLCLPFQVSSANAWVNSWFFFLAFNNQSNKTFQKANVALCNYTLQQKKVAHKLLQAFILVKPWIIKHTFYACISYIFHPYLVLIVCMKINSSLNHSQVTRKTQDKM